MRKDEMNKICEYITTSISRTFSLTSLGYEVQLYHNGAYLLYNSKVLSYKDYCNLILIITHAAEDRVKHLEYKKENNK